MNVVLLEPEIPQNTGNIARTCAVTGSVLHLIRPLGFAISDKHLKRAGMDYWYDLDIRYYDGFDEFMESQRPESLFLATTKAAKTYAEVSYPEDCYLVFGKESAGIPEEILIQHPTSCIRIPMLEKYRSINISSSVAIILYEAQRQNGFSALSKEGALHRLQWNSQPSSEE